MSFVTRSARPFAAATAFAVLIGGLALAPTVAASAASTASQVTSTVSKINSSRSGEDLGKVKVANDLNEFATGLSADLAKAGTSSQDAFTFDQTRYAVPNAPEGGAYVFLTSRVTGSSSTVAASVVKKAKAESSKTEKTGVYGSYKNVGVGFTKKGKYTYSVIFLAKYTLKLQDSTKPKITGTRSFGKTLTASVSGWTVGDGQREFVWIADDNGQVGDGKTLELTSDLVGKRITLIVTVAREGYETQYRFSSATSPIGKATLTSATPKVTGSYVVGKTLTVVPGTWTKNTEFSFQWKADGTAIADATGSTFVITEAQQGKKITVTVKGTKPGYASASKTSVNKTATLGVFDSPKPTITVPDETTGTVVTAVIGTWTPKASSYSYQWYRDGVAIKKATAKNYTTVDADVAKNLTVTVTGTKSGYKARSVTSEPHLFGVTVS